MRDGDIAACCVAHEPMATDGRFVAGTVFGDWRLTAFIGRGGNGEVYCAEHLTLGSPAAVKVLMREDERAKERFVREAKLLAKLNSDAFPRFFAYGEANGYSYLAMELLEPGDLPASDRAIARFMLKVCDAVAELHAQNLVHRDVKPSNILWRTGEPCSRTAAADPVLADLGLVKDITASNIGHSASSVTCGGVGTPGYSAPEQMERGEATVASDIHALGVLADRCFDGKPPRVWARIIQRATSSIPSHRYSSVAAFARAIRRRHWLGKTLLSLGSIGILATSVMFLKRPVQSLYREYKARRLAPVISASATINGKVAKDARWFIDGMPIEMPHSVTEKDSRASPGKNFHLYAVARRGNKTYSAKKWLLPDWQGTREISMKLGEDPAAGASIRIWTSDGVPFDFVWCPPGEDVVSCIDDKGTSCTGHVSVGCGYWIAKYELTCRQFIALSGTNVVRYTPISWRNRIDRHSDLPALLYFAGPDTVPSVYIHGSGVRFEPPDPLQWEHAARQGGGLPPETEISACAWTSADKKKGDVAAGDDESPFKGGQKRPNSLGMYDVYGNVSEWVWVSSDLKQNNDENTGGWMALGGSYAHDYAGLRDCAERTARLLCGLSVPVYGVFGPGRGAAGVRFVAISYCEHETNTVWYCAAKELLRSSAPEDVERGKAMLKEAIGSDDSALALLARECCIEHGLLSLDDCGGTNAPSVLRRAAIRHGGDAQMLERMAMDDPDPEVREKAFARISNPSPMFSARYISRFKPRPGMDLATPIAVIRSMTDRKALGYISRHSHGIFHETVQKRLDRLAEKQQ